MLIAGFGMPGSGKTTVIQHLGLRLSVPAFLEPEETEWPEAVSEREVCGYATAVHWFRSARVPGLFKAKQLSMQGGTALVDSYYDKLWSKYIGLPGMEWLLPPSDPYFANLKQLAELDYARLPDADVLILFEVERDNHRLMLGRRGRLLDKKSALSERFDTQRHFVKAAEQYVSERNGATRLIRFTNPYSTPDNAASELEKLLNPPVGARS